jgi:hypothetical protein
MSCTAAWRVHRRRGGIPRADTNVERRIGSSKSLPFSANSARKARSSDALSFLTKSLPTQVFAETAFAGTLRHRFDQDI